MLWENFKFRRNISTHLITLLPFRLRWMNVVPMNSEKSISSTPVSERLGNYLKKLVETFLQRAISVLGIDNILVPYANRVSSKV